MSTTFKIVITYDLFYKRDVCLNCGAPVHTAYTKEGKAYLGEPARNSIHGGFFSPAHRCDLYSADDSSLLYQANLIAKGEMVVGQNVRVAKGRKIPVGSTGEIVWLGRDSFDATSARALVLLSDGAKEYTSIKNLVAINAEGEDIR